MPSFSISVEGAQETFEVPSDRPNAKQISMAFTALDEKYGKRWLDSAGKRQLAVALRSAPVTPKQEPTGPILADEPSRFAVQDVEDLRGAFISGGAIAGGVAGTGAGPLGTAAGLALGAAGGSAGFEAAKDIGRRTGLVGERGLIADRASPPPFTGSRHPDLDPTIRAIEEAALDVLVPGIGRILRDAGKAVAKRVAKVGSESSRRIVTAARDLGIPIGIEAVSANRFITGTRKTLGKMPLLGTAFRQSNEQVAGALREAKDSLLHEVAPVVTTISRSGIDLNTAQVRRQKAASRLFSSAYESLMKRAESAGAVVRTTNIVERANDLVRTWRTNLPKKLVKGKKQPITPITDPKIIDFAEKELSGLAETMTPRQYQRLSIELNALIDEAGDNRALKQQAVLLKDALLKDLEAMEGGTFSSEIRELNKRFSTWLKLLSGQTGKRFGRASSGVFEAEITEGSRNADVLFKQFFDAKSPTAMRELRALVGKKPFRAAVRQHIDGAFDAAQEASKDGVFFNLQSIRKNLGLGVPKSAEYQTLKAALEAAETGVKIGDLEKFFGVAEAHFKLGVVDVSQFVARRAQIGGARAAIRALIPGASVMSSGTAGGVAGGISGYGLAVGAMFVLGIRGMTRLMTNPKYLKSMTQLGGKTATDEMRRRAYTRVVRLLLEEAARSDAAAVGGLNDPNPQASQAFGLGGVTTQLDRLGLAVAQQ